MRWKRTTIIGVGLMGGSLGLALRERKLAECVVGVGRRKRSVARALRLGACDEVTTDVPAGVKGADLVVVATPVAAVVPVLHAAAAALGPESVVTDVASTKSHITHSVASSLGYEQIRFVGGHPLVGSEKTGVENASATLYEGATVVLTPVEGTDTDALEKVTELWRSLGASVKHLDPEEHDAILAQTSHLPHLVAAALVNALARGWGSYIGPGFLDTTRVAGADPKLWKDIFLSNAADVVRSLARFRRELLALENALATEPDALEKLLTRAHRARQSLSSQSAPPRQRRRSSKPKKKRSARARGS